MPRDDREDPEEVEEAAGVTFDPTTDPDLRSWVASANDPATDFPIQNLPFGIFKRRDSNQAPRIGVAIGDQIIDVAEVASLGWVGDGQARITAACQAPRLNGLMTLGREAVRSVRRQLSRLMTDGEDASARREAARFLVPMRDCVLSLPADIGDYTDFYASIDHATNVGSMFRPNNPLLPNYKWIPIGYHGRASSIVISGNDISRPCGQSKPEGAERPEFGPSRRLDYEVEIGAFIGEGNALGAPIPIDDAERHVFGLCLVNDWSARDIQSWEYQPLGPFLAKSFATTISPWVVTLDALEPFRVPATARPPGDPQPLPYLTSSNGGFEISVDAFMTTERMRASGIPPFRVSRGNLSSLYWTLSQLVTHHTSNGCNLRPGDLLATGTISGTDEASRGCLLERAWGGSAPLTLPTNETRAFLENGDEVTLRAFCERSGRRRIGFGECVGRIVQSA